MGFDHASPANLCGDIREELVLRDPTARHVCVYAQEPVHDGVFTEYHGGPRQYNPRLMDKGFS